MSRDAQDKDSTEKWLTGSLANWLSAGLSV